MNTGTTPLRIATCLVGSLLACGSIVGVYAEEAPPAVSLPDIARQMSAARKAAESDDAPLEDRIRFATWALMLAEFSIEPHGLVSTASDLFDEGQTVVADLRKELAADPEAEKALVMRAPLIAARLDATVAREARVAERRELARGQERERLDDLRSIAKAFRAGLAAQSEAQAWAAVGDVDKAETSLAEAWRALDEIDRTVAERRDFYLMDDEPPLEVNPDAVLVTVAPTTFRSPVIVANAKALAALRLLAVVEQPGRDLYQDADSAKILDKSAALANAALSDDAPLPDAPRGSSPDNTFALYARGRAAVLAAVLRAWRTPFDEAVREDVAMALQRAEADYTAALAKLGEHADSSLHSRITECLRELKSPEFTQARITRSIAAGMMDQAVIEARSLAMRQPAPDFIALYLDTARRAGLPLADLQDWCRRFVAGGTGLEPTASPALRMALGRLAAEAFANRVTSPEWSNAAAADREAASRDALAARETASTPEGASESDAASLAATRALLAAYAWLASAELPGGRSLLAAAVEDARNAELFLSKAIADATGRDQDADVLDQRESLVHCRLARGFLAIALLPDYRDEARLAFAAALDEAGRLPQGGQGHRMLGSPLLTGLLRGDGTGQAAQLVAEERSTRQAMTRFVEACFAMEFGAPAQATEQFKIAHDMAQRGRNAATAADAAEMMRVADGFDVAITLPESMAAFEVLGLVAAGQQHAALRRAAALSREQAGHAGDVDPADEAAVFEAITTEAESLRSPLVAYAILRALDARLDAVPLGQDSARAGVLRALRACQTRCSQLLDTARQRDRYPHVAQLVTDYGRELDDDATFASARDLPTVERGLRRHPGSSQLWNRYFEVMALVSAGVADSRKSEERSLAMLDALANDPLVPAAALRLSRAALLERLARYPLAEQEYAQARQTGTTAEDRIVAASREAVLRVRNAFGTSNGRE